MNNIYNSANFLSQSKSAKRKVLTHGVTSKVMIVIPSSIKKEELKSEKAQIETKETAKEAVLKGDPKIPNLLNLLCMTPILSTTSVWFQKS